MPSRAAAWTCTALRVSFVTLALEHGATPKAVQAIVGHATLDLTMNVYARVTEHGKRQAIGALPFAQVSPPDAVSPPEQIINAPAVRTLCAKSATSPQTPAFPVVRQLTIGF